jgi:hypothetical protein
MFLSSSIHYLAEANLCFFILAHRLKPVAIHALPPVLAGGTNKLHSFYWL